MTDAKNMYVAGASSLHHISDDGSRLMKDCYIQLTDNLLYRAG